VEVVGGAEGVRSLEAEAEAEEEEGWEGGEERRLVASL